MVDDLKRVVQVLELRRLVNRSENKLQKAGLEHFFDAEDTWICTDRSAVQ